MNKIKVSVIVPICNVEKYLSKCLDSLITQKLKDIEIICINDGSKDRSLEIIKEFEKKDSRIVVIDKINTGYGDSMNYGLLKAKGEYVGIVESDDFADMNMFENLYQMAKKYNADIAKSNYYLFWDNPEKIIYYNNLNVSSVINVTDICKEKLLRATCSIWSAVYKKDFIIKNNIFFLTTPGASYQDTSFKFKSTLLAKNIVLSPEAFLYYRQDNANSSVKMGTYEKAMLLHKEYEEMYSFLQNHGLSKFKKLFYEEVLDGCLWNYLRINKKDKEKYFNSMAILLRKYGDVSFNKNCTSKYLEFGGANTISNGNRRLLDLLIILSKIKQKLTKNEN